MKTFLVRTGINALGLWAAAAIVTGIHLGQDPADASSKVITVLGVALVFGFVNALLRPIAEVLSFPLIILTLGIFMLVVNAAMLQTTSWLAGKLDLAFHVDHFFWDAVVGAVVISVVGIIANIVLPDRWEVKR